MSGSKTEVLSHFTDFIFLLSLIIKSSEYLRHLSSSIKNNLIYVSTLESLNLKNILNKRSNLFFSLSLQIFVFTRTCMFTYIHKGID